MASTRLLALARAAARVRFTPLLPSRVVVSLRSTVARCACRGLATAPPSPPDIKDVLRTLEQQAELAAETDEVTPELLDQIATWRTFAPGAGYVVEEEVEEEGEDGEELELEEGEEGEQEEEEEEEGGEEVEGEEESEEQAQAEAQDGKASDLDFGEFRPKSKGRTPGVSPSSAAASRASEKHGAVEEGEEEEEEEEEEQQQTGDEMMHRYYQGETGLEAPDITHPEPDFDAPYKYTKHMRLLMRMYEARDLDGLLEAYYSSKLRMATLPPPPDESDLEDDSGEFGTQDDMRSTYEPATFDDDFVTRGPDYLEYNIVLDACAKAGRMDIANSILQNLVEERGLLTSDIFTLIMKAAAIAGQTQFAHDAWQLMIDSDCKPTVHTYAAMICIHMQTGKYEEAVNLFNRMKRSGIEPNETMFYFIFEGLFKSKRYDVAHDVWRTVRNTLLFEPEEPFYSMLLIGFAGGHRVFEIQQVISRMRRKRYGSLWPSPDAFMAMFNCYLELGKVDDAAKLVSTMRNAGILNETDLPLDAIRAAAENFPAKEKLAVNKQFAAVNVPGLDISKIEAEEKKREEESAAAAEDEEEGEEEEEEEEDPAFFDKPDGFIHVSDEKKKEE